jgi:histidyl-tRNA synthetase
MIWLWSWETRASGILIVGENEVKADAFALKNLATGEQVSVPRGELARRIRNHG